MKPIFEVAEHLREGRLVPVATATPPTATQLSCLSQHRRFRDPKIRLFVDFIVARIKADMAARMQGLVLEPNG
jgi:DNA-binding transcriptional LysR family regulator